MGMLVPVFISAAVILQQAVPQGANQPPEVVVILADNWLRAYCIIGSVLGAILSIAIYPPQEPASKNSIRQSATKLIVSLLSGIVFTPVLVRYLDVPLDGDWILFGAGTVSLLSVSVLTAALPLITLMAKRRVKDVIGKVMGSNYIPDSDTHGDSPPRT